MTHSRTWLKDIRTKKAMTQSDVSEKVGIERSYYTMIEQGNRNPSVRVAKDIASVLNFEWIIFFENECNESKQIS